MMPSVMLSGLSIQDPPEEEPLEISLEIIKLLVSLGGTLDLRDGKGRTPLDVAVESRSLPTVKCLLDAGTDVNNICGTSGRYERETPLHLAAANSSVEVVELLLERGADFNIPNRSGETPLLCAGKAGRMDIMMFLRSRGADPFAADLRGRGALMLSAGSGSEAACTWLLNDIGENPNRRDADKKTPLHIAAEMGHIGVVKMLLDHGAHPHARDITSLTPSDYSSSKHVLVTEILLKHMRNGN